MFHTGIILILVGSGFWGLMYAMDRFFELGMLDGDAFHYFLIFWLVAGILGMIVAHRFSQSVWFAVGAGATNVIVLQVIAVPDPLKPGGIFISTAIIVGLLLGISWMRFGLRKCE